MRIKTKKRWRFAESILETVKYIKKKYFLFVSMIFFDFLFLLSVYVLGALARNIFKTGSFAVIAALLVYCLLIIVVYSFFKFIILNLIRKMVKNVRFSLKKSFGFFGLNIIVIGALFTVFLVLSAAAYYLIRGEYKAAVIRVIFALSLVLGYPLVNLVHSFFMHNFSIKESIAKGARLYGKVRQYLSVYIFSMLFLAAYFLCYALIALILKYLFFDELLSRYNDTYVLIFSVISLLVFYFILAFNRIYFYLIADKDVLP